MRAILLGIVGTTAFAVILHTQITSFYSYKEAQLHDTFIDYSPRVILGAQPAVSSGDAQVRLPTYTPMPTGQKPAASDPTSEER